MGYFKNMALREPSGRGTIGEALHGPISNRGTLAQLEQEHPQPKPLPKPLPQPVYSLLYQPTALEVCTILDRARSAWPDLRKPITKAEQILLTPNSIVADQDYRYIVFSQTDEKHTYHVCTNEGERACGCPCYTDEPMYTPDGRRFCKHLFALHAYLEILRNHLQARVVGLSSEVGTRRRLEANPDTYLMRIEHTRTVTNMAQQRVFISVQWGTNRKLDFTSNAEAALFAWWLRTAAPLHQHKTNLNAELDYLTRQEQMAEWQAISAAD